MATDFVHTSEIVQAVINVLKGADADLHTGGLPADWFDRTHDERLKAIMFGDLADYVSQEAFLNDLPAIIVRGLGCESTGRSGAGGVLETAETIRVIHARHYTQCYNDDGDPERNMLKARLRYAKIINKALFNDPHKRLAVIAADGTRTDVSLTCSDTNGAQIVNVEFGGWDFGIDGGTKGTEEVRLLRRLPIQAWAIACDLRVTIRSG